MYSPGRSLNCRIIRGTGATAPIEEARARLTREECPRRYCWYWHSLSFDWDLKPEDGCGVADEHIGDTLLKRSGAEVGPWRRCCRASGNLNSFSQIKLDQWLDRSCQYAK